MLEIVASSSVTVPLPTNTPDATLNDALAATCKVVAAVKPPLKSGTPSRCASASAPSACQSSFGAATPAAVVALLIESAPPEIPSESTDSNPIKSAKAPLDSRPR